MGICGLQWQKRLEKCARTRSLSCVSPISGKAFKKFLSHTSTTIKSPDGQIAHSKSKLENDEMIGKYSILGEEKEFLFLKSWHRDNVSSKV